MTTADYDYHKQTIQDKHNHSNKLPS